MMLSTYSSKFIIDIDCNNAYIICIEAIIICVDAIIKETKIMERRLMKKIERKYFNQVRDCRLKAMIAKQEQLSQMTGINRSTINALENNRLFLSSHYALLIAEVLNCKLDEL